MGGYMHYKTMYCTLHALSYSPNPQPHEEGTPLIFIQEGNDLPKDT